MIRLFQSFIRHINSPFPDSGDFKKSAKEFVVISFFVASFLYFFRPFGLDGYQGTLIFMCLGYGLVTYIISIAFEWCLLYVLKIDKEGPNWTLGKWILNVVVLIFLISIGNYFYSALTMEWKNISFKGLSIFIRYTLLVGIFPIVISGLITQIRNQKKNVKTALELSKRNNELPIPHHAEKIKIASQSDEETLILSSEQLMYLEATENYVGVYFLSDEKINKKLIRNTLKAIKETLPTRGFLQCHRSFIVNLELIEEIQGNAQGLKIILKTLPDRMIPVSRKYIPELRRLIG